jgi:hypothetical protein
MWGLLFVRASVAAKLRPTQKSPATNRLNGHRQCFDFDQNSLLMLSAVTRHLQFSRTAPGAPLIVGIAGLRLVRKNASIP